MRTSYLQPTVGLFLVIISLSCFAQNELNYRTIRTKELKASPVLDDPPPLPPPPAPKQDCEAILFSGLEKMPYLKECE